MTTRNHKRYSRQIVIDKSFRTRISWMFLIFDIYENCEVKNVLKKRIKTNHI
jgi:hypothetical protein